MPQLRSVDEIGLSRKSKAKVAEWLKQWLEHVVQFADGKEGTVLTANFQDMDFFYFTDCKDILEKDPLLEDDENKRKMRWRKSAVMLQLMLKSMMGQKLGQIVKCTHCGFEGVKTLYCEGGYWKWCPKCKRIIVDTYLHDFARSVQDVSKQLNKINTGAK